MVCPDQGDETFGEKDGAGVRGVVSGRSEAEREFTVSQSRYDADLVLRKELDQLARSRGARVHYLVGSRHQHPMSFKYLRQIVPMFADAEVYVCGPESLVQAVKTAADDCGIPKNRFHDEAFAYHGN